MTRTPFDVSTREVIAVRICSAEGDAKMVPATAAESMPWPTMPAKEGSWPEPPPEIMDTCALALESGRR